MRDPEQKMRFNNAELATLKALFAGNEEPLYSIRKVMLQGELTEAEEVALRKLITPAVWGLLKKFFLPDIEVDAPLFQMSDLFIGLDSDLKNGPDLAHPFILAKELEIAYLKQQMDVLGGEDKKPKIVFKDLTNTEKESTAEDKWVKLTARNYLLSFIDSNIQQIIFLAGTKEETVEETKERLKKNSNK